jgi:hypothetical protein
MRWCKGKSLLVLVLHRPVADEVILPIASYGAFGGVAMVESCRSELEVDMLLACNVLLEDVGGVVV